MKRFLLVTVMLLVAAFSAAPMQADLLTFSPLNQVVPLGTPASVSILLDTPLVGDFDLVVSWDPSILSFDSYSLGSLLGDPSLGEAIDGFVVTASSLGVFEISLLDPLLELPALQGAGPIDFFSITFDTIGIGTSPLIFSAPPPGVRASSPPGMSSVYSGISRFRTEASRFPAMAAASPSRGPCCCFRLGWRRPSPGCAAAPDSST